MCVAYLGPCHLKERMECRPHTQGCGEQAAAHHQPSSLHSCGLDPSLCGDLVQDSFGMIKGMFVEEAAFVWFLG